MFVGVARIVVQIPGARSLKDRRGVVRSYKDRVRARLRISVAEVGDAERWADRHLRRRHGVLRSRQCEELIASAVSIARSLPEAVLADVRTETLAFGRGGEGLRHGIETALDDD